MKPNDVAPDSARIRAAVTGLGFGRFHAASLAANDQVDLVALCQRHETSPSRAAFGEHYGVDIYADTREMLDAVDVDLLVIASRPSTHEALLREAAKRGIACVVEKPLTGSLSAVDRLATEFAADAWVAVNFELRCLPVVAELKRLLDEGILGEPILLTMHYVMDPIPAESWLWQAGEGGTPIVENSVHVLDLVRHLLGEVDLDYAVAWNALGPGSPAPDMAIAQLSTPGGARVSLALGAAATKARRVPMRLDLVCSDAQATLEGVSHGFSKLSYATRADTEVTVFEPAPVAQRPPGGFGESVVLAPAVRQAVADLVAGRPPFATLHDGVAAQRLTTQIAQARG